MENEYEIVINNKKIHTFYQDHPNIDFERVNLMLIDFLDTLFNNVTSYLYSNINSQLLSYMSNNKQEIDNIKHSMTSLKETMSKMNIDNMNSINTQLSNIKKEYIDDVRDVICNNNIKTDEKLGILIEKNNSHLLDKTNILLNDIIPKNQERSNLQLYSNIKDFHSKMNEEITKMFNSSNNDKSIHTFLANFDNKYA